MHKETRDYFTHSSFEMTCYFRGVEGICDYQNERRSFAMKKYQSKITDKKKLVRKLEALTGKTATYTRVPRCAYQIDEYFVEKDGNLTVEHERENDEVVTQLQAEGMLGGEVQEEQGPRVHMVRAGNPTTKPGGICIGIQEGIFGV